LIRVFNEIERLNQIILKNKLKLKYIGFYANKFKMINPISKFGGNICVNRELKKSESTLVEMNEDLQICYNNCLLDIDCISETVEDS
jgi:hypothetical protein